VFTLEALDDFGQPVLDVGQRHLLRGAHSQKYSYFSNRPEPSLTLDTRALTCTNNESSCRCEDMALEVAKVR
jgi:hypothetical protein